MYEHDWAQSVSILDEVDHAITIEDGAGIVCLWNRAAEHVYGISAINAMGCRMDQLIAVEQCSAPKTVRDAILASVGRWQGSAVHVSHLGIRLWVDWSLISPSTAPGRTISLVKVMAPPATAGSESDHLSRLSKDLQCIVNLDGTFKQINPAWTQILGWSEAEVLAMPWTNLIHPEDIAQTIKTATEHTAQNKKHFTVENRYRHKDGSYLTLSWSVFILSDKREVFAIARDLTEFQRTQKQLSLSEIRAERLINSSPMGIIQYQLEADDRLVLVDTNPSSNQILGTTREQLIGKTIEEAFPPLASTEVPDRYRRAARDGEPWHTTDLVYQDNRITGAFDVWAFQTYPNRMAALFLDVTEQSQIKEALRSSQEKFAKAFHASPALMSISSIDEGRFLDVNPSFERLTGYTRQEAIGQTIIGLGLLPDPLLFDQVMQQLRILGAIHDIEVPFINSAQETRQGSFSLEIFELGQQQLVMTVMSDITERALADSRQQARLERIQKQQAAIFKLATQASLYDGDLTRALHSLTEIVAEALGVERVSFWLLSDDRATLRCLDQFLKSTAQHTMMDPLAMEQFPGYLIALEADRALDAHDVFIDPRTQELAPFFRQQGITSMLDAAVRISGAVRGVVCHEHVGSPRTWRPDEIAFAGAVADQAAQAITTFERQRMERSLRESEAMLRSIFRSAPIGICLVTGITITWINDKMAGILGYSLEELSGQDIHHLYPQSLAHHHHVLTLQLREQEGATLETRWVKKNGDLIDVLLNATCLDSANADPGITITALDITEQKKAEADKMVLENQLRQSQKMEAIGRLAGGIAHDFNNLLTGIIGYCDLIFSSLSPDDPISSELREIQKASERAAELTNQLLAFSRKQIIDPKIIEPNKIITRSQKMMERIIGEDIELTFHPAKDLYRIKADPGQLDQILINLATNSRDAMPQGGQLTIETRNVTLDETFCNIRAEIAPGQYILLAFTDSGCGMSESVQKNIFEPFFSTKPKDKGTGLGMSMVYGIVKQNNGYISIYSEESIGTTVKIYFPRVMEEPRAEPNKTTTFLATGKEHILLVEDEDIVRQLAKTVLQGRGYIVLEAANGLQALQISQEYEEHLDLLLTDVVLPKMNGKELFFAIQKTRPEIKVLFVSGYTEDVIAHHGILDEGMNFLQKPFNIAALTERVREILDN